MNCTQNALIDFAKKNCENYTRGFMKKFLGILVSDFVIVNTSQAEKYLDVYMFNKKKRSNYG